MKVRSGFVSNSSSSSFVVTVDWFRCLRSELKNTLLGLNIEGDEVISVCEGEESEQSRDDCWITVYYKKEE